jgi:hypothetical protein
MTTQNENSKSALTVCCVLLLIVLFLVSLVFFAIKFSAQPKESQQAVVQGCYMSTQPNARFYLQRDEIYTATDIVSKEHVRIGSFETTFNDCVPVGAYMLKYENVLNESLASKVIIPSAINDTKVNDIIKQRSFFLVNNPNSQITMNGNIDATANGPTGHSCSLFSCVSNYATLDIKGTVTLSGEIAAPLSIISEKEFYNLVAKNPNDFVKCYKTSINSAANRHNEYVKKLICGIEKNNVFVTAEIVSAEDATEACKNIELIVHYEHYDKTVKFVPVNGCNDKWQLK